MSVSLLSTKLTAPRAHANLVPRPRLLERLDAGLQRPLTVISAPAGSGKTSLLSEWAAHHEQCIAWLSLDGADNDAMRFWTYLTAALQTLRAQGQPNQGIEPFLTLLLNEIVALDTDIALVLDDYHFISAAAIHHGVTFLLDPLPPQMHLYIVSRADPALPLARWRARGPWDEIRAGDLRFTLDETATFLNQVMGLGLLADDIAALEARTEGWVVGLQLAALSMRGRADVAEFIAGFAGSHRYIVDYLTEETLHRQASEWYEHNGFVDEAIQHALAGEDFERAARLMEEHASIIFWVRGEIGTLLGWLEALPGELVRARPRLGLFHAWALLLSGQLAAIEPHLEDVERSLSSASQPDIQRSQGEAAAIRSRLARMRNDLPGAIKLSRLALELLPLGDVFLRGVITLNLGIAYWQSGNVTLAIQNQENDGGEINDCTKPRGRYHWGKQRNWARDGGGLCADWRSGCHYRAGRGRTTRYRSSDWPELQLAAR